MKKANSINNKLSQRVLLYIVLCSAVLSICSTIVQLYADFQDNLVVLDNKFSSIQTSNIPSMATSLWDFNQPLVEQQIRGLVELSDIMYVKVTTDFGNEYAFGDDKALVEKSSEFPIIYGENTIGTLRVSANYDDIYQVLLQKASFIITSEFIKIFIVAFCIIFIVHWLITRHIFLITDYSQQLSSNNLDEELTLDNRSKDKDELDYLVDAINGMRLNLKNDIVKLEDAENALISLNGELEVKVFDRTSKLATTNEELQHSLDNLTLAKDQLVQSEKMASLGQLVAGVAHEVNTPLGICVTSITALKEKLDGLVKTIESEELTKSYLTKTLNLLIEYQQIIERSLNKSVDLIRGFKSVAVEQHTDPEININLSQHVNDVVNTVKTLFKRKKYHINLSIDPDFNLITYPSAWNQILTNFLMNSHIHGFEDKLEGEISIEFTESNGYLTLLYSDNGKGLDSSIKNKIFDPFVTTKRGQGGSGLGMNIVFNLVDAKLGGTIKVIETKQGCCFKVKVPIQQSKKK